MKVSDNMVNKNISSSEESQKAIRDKEKRGRYIKRLISIDREIDRLTEERIQLDKETKDLKDKLLKDKRIEKLLYKYKIYDTKYSNKLEVLGRRYDKTWDHAGLSREKLSLEEIFVILTWLHRAERHAGGFFYEAIKQGTFYNLLKRMEEIRNEL